MQEPQSIRILESDPNKRGDLFARLMADLFVALGYEQPQPNIHKSGREVDLTAEHRLESRRAIAECKATTEAVGGDDLNKFVGVLDAEQEENRPTTGYFISLGGFRETAIEQEKKRRKTKIITLDGQQVLDELVKGRILISKARATEQAGRCRPDALNCILAPELDLLAHQRGWLWAVYYTQGGLRTHVALIHSDGTPLARQLADEVITTDLECGGSLHSLECLNAKPADSGIADEDLIAAKTAYSEYIAMECGFIQLDGLPADGEAGSRRLRLENLFVPLHLDMRAQEKKRQPIGSVLATHPRLALLAAPGGGKTTLIKRLAVAYSDLSRRNEISDDLPRRDWLPVFFRCRDLRSLARSSFAELLESLSLRERVRQHAKAFRRLVDQSLSAGEVLLLVDGLDEISDPGDRAAFVCTMRMALQAYPGTAMVVTSREAGFRHIAAHLAPVCTHATLSPFDSSDIRRLSLAWHKETVGDTEKVRTDAELLANSISQSDRINRLAVNPLLLTTLLLVRRWVGSLPTRRAVLYGKAVEVLLMTWNTEGHDPIPDGEALPQLCYVASAMMMEKRERISRPRLAALLQEARSALPTELGYVSGSVEEFIHRVEDRSSLLMMTGHDVENGLLVEFFEFRHLTFQEFLTARAMVEGWHPGRMEGDTLEHALAPFLDEDKWREVVPLAAVLGGKATEALIQQMTARLLIFARDSQFPRPESSLHAALTSCLADEAAVRPDILRSAVQSLVRLGLDCIDQGVVPMLCRGRYGPEVRIQAAKELLSAESPIAGPSSALQAAVWHQTFDGETFEPLTFAEHFIAMLKQSDATRRCEGALGCAALLRAWFVRPLTPKQLASSTNYLASTYANVFESIGSATYPLLYSELVAEQYASGWALYELGKYRVWRPPADPDVLGRMYELFQNSKHSAVRNGMAGTIAHQPILQRDAGRCASVPRKEFHRAFKSLRKNNSPISRIATLIVAWYIQEVDDTLLLQKTQSMIDRQQLMHDHSLRRQLDDLKQLLVSSALLDPPK